jgi:hypothetical protein
MALPAKGQLRSSEGNINRGRIGEEKAARHRLPRNPGDPVQANPFRTVIADPENPVAELKVLLSDPDWKLKGTESGAGVGGWIFTLW